MRRTIAVLALLTLVSACATSSTGTPAGKAAQRVTQPTEAPSPDAALPTAADFTIKLHILKKNCFGSAGCNITYRIDPHYAGSENPPAVTVTYQVLGGEDGPQINSFKIGADGQASIDDEETISTTSPTVVLRAKVTEVIAE